MDQLRSVGRVVQLALVPVRQANEALGVVGVVALVLVLLGITAAAGVSLVIPIPVESATYFDGAGVQQTVTVAAARWPLVVGLPVGLIGVLFVIAGYRLQRQVDRFEDQFRYALAVTPFVEPLVDAADAARIGLHVHNTAGAILTYRVETMVVSDGDKELARKNDSESIYLQPRPETSGSFRVMARGFDWGQTTTVRLDYSIVWGHPDAQPRFRIRGAADVHFTTGTASWDEMSRTYEDVS